MDVIQTFYQFIWLKPVYNTMIWCYTALGQQQSGLTLILIGLILAGLAIPLMIRGFKDQRQTKQLAEDIDRIKSEIKDPDQQQAQILQLLKKKQIHFQSESLFLFVVAGTLVAIYPVLLHYWQHVDTSLLYSFTPVPTNFSPEFGPINVGRSSPTLSLLPAILLFVELRQSYREQQFLTSAIDRWYPIILPLCVYFLIFWLPSGLSLVMSAMLIVSLYVRFLLESFATKRRTAKS